MKRRAALTTCGSICFGLLSSGCLDTVRREDAWRELIVDPPDGVYIPPKIDEVMMYGQAEINGCILSVMATQPHSFWSVTGTNRNRADLRSAHSLHLMVSFWDGEAGIAIPRPIRISIYRNEVQIDRRSLWPMITQQMGFHYGDNVVLEGDSTYTAEIQLEHVDALITGGFSDRFDAVDTVDLEFEYSSAEIANLNRTLIDADEGRGERGAIEPIEMHDHHGSNGINDERDNSPVSILPPAELLPGKVVGIGNSNDISFIVTVIEVFLGC